MAEYTYDEIEKKNGESVDTDKLVEEYLKKGGKIKKIPEGVSTVDRRSMPEKSKKKRDKWQDEMDKVTVPRDPNLRFYGSISMLEHLQEQSPLTWVEMVGGTPELTPAEWSVVKKADLSGAQLICLYLCFWCDKTQAEVADFLGITRKAVERRVYRAKQKLYPFLKELQAERKNSPK